eukprot:jgi/Mesvir1/2159/Mv16672-RA.1
MAGFKKLGLQLDMKHTEQDPPNDLMASYKLTDAGTLNLLSQSCGEYNINQDGFEKRVGSPGMGRPGDADVSYKCSSSEMMVFNAVGRGASSVVRKAIHIPTHRFVALKNINVFDREKRQQMLNEIRMLCDAGGQPGLVSFFGAFFTPDSGQISIVLEYMDGGSLADALKKMGRIPEDVLSQIAARMLTGLNYLHQNRHLVHRDIKPANLLLNLKGEAKITDFGISAGLDNTIAMCATFVGTVTYMSPERINNEPYSFPADIWSLGLTLLESGTGVFPYNATTGPLALMLQVMNDPSPLPPEDGFSPEFRDFVGACLQKDPTRRPSAEMLLQHPWILKYSAASVDLGAFVRSVFDPREQVASLAQMFITHYYQLMDGGDASRSQLSILYRDSSSLTYMGSVCHGGNAINAKLAECARIHAALGRITHTADHVDSSSCYSGEVMIMVSGRLVPDAGARGGLAGISSAGAGHSFAEVFVICPSERPGEYWVSNQIFRLL